MLMPLVGGENDTVKHARDFNPGDVFEAVDTSGNVARIRYLGVVRRWHCHFLPTLPGSVTRFPSEIVGRTAGGGIYERNKFHMVRAAGPVRPGFGSDARTGKRR